MYLTQPRLTTGQGKVKSKKASGFFSPQSFVDGFTNNALGVVGFVAEGIKEEVLFAPRRLRPAHALRGSFCANKTLLELLL